MPSAIAPRSSTRLATCIVAELEGVEHEHGITEDLLGRAHGEHERRARAVDELEVPVRVRVGAAQPETELAALEGGDVPAGEREAALVLDHARDAITRDE